MEKLVEGVARILIDHVFVRGWEHRNDMIRDLGFQNAKELREWLYEGGIDPFTEIHIKRTAKHLITHISSAIYNGLEIPGEAGRIDTIARKGELPDWIDHVLTFHKADLLIALCPTGTGKEEE